MKPGAPRAYDPAFDSAILLGTGAAHSVSDEPEQRPRSIARLYVPDPEQRHGWREYYVYPETTPTERHAGFRR